MWKDSINIITIEDNRIGFEIDKALNDGRGLYGKLLFRKFECNKII